MITPDKGTTPQGRQRMPTGTAAATPEGIAFYQLCARRAALKLELIGLKRRGRTAYSIVKEVYGLKGTRQRVLAQLEALIAEAHRRNEGTTV